MDLLKRYVEAHNEIVRAGKSDALAQLFDERAEMHFHASDSEHVLFSSDGIPVGPFIGRDAIVRALHEEPPTDELVLTGDGRYGWKNGGPGGEFRVTLAGGLITGLCVIVFPPP